ncbi:uncharacterized protein LOC108101042 [Drosophila ficusphila]|uniref:uncharacterized protein LOC108101042 n=1 Tax=Drosophila ficusphila TaxID=30025 RepID=UPI0007E678C8|nr:uncharacterized protein LOC108101042 [Drosophila ficusphila]
MNFLTKVRHYWKNKVRKLRPRDPLQTANQELEQSSSEIYAHPTDAFHSLKRDFDTESEDVRSLMQCCSTDNR